MNVTSDSSWHDSRPSAVFSSDARF